MALSACQSTPKIADPTFELPSPPTELQEKLPPLETIKVPEDKGE